ncbi:MAG: DEAD/DEAH box helicase [Thermoprotei archaeon]
MKIDELKIYGIPEKIVEILKANQINELYPPQIKAIEAGALHGKNLVLASPTASGKTLVALLAAFKLFYEKGLKTLYLTPLRAIASEKYEDLKMYEKGGIRVAISTGDYDSSDPWLKDYDIIVTTNEKADSLLRHHASWLRDVGLIVADEIHLLDSIERGPTLEFLLTRLRTELPEAQIMALSATIGNAEEIAEWLNASCIETDWRPVPLREGVYYDGMIYYDNGDKKKIPIIHESSVVNLSIDTLKNGGQALVFASTRQSAVRYAHKHENSVPKFLTDDEKRILREAAETLIKISEDKITLDLANLVKNGVAFHHAGLSYHARSIIEKLFRDRILKIICATPTLAAGVNVPARRVIVAELHRFNVREGISEEIPIMEYKQLAGRAGRPKYDEYGEAIIIAPGKLHVKRLLDEYVNGNIEDISSKLDNESAMRSHILSLFATDVVSDTQSMHKFLSKTFYAYTVGSQHVQLVANRILRYLVSSGFLEENEGRFSATALGKRVAELYIDPSSAYTIISILNKRESLTAFGYLYTIVLTDDMPKLSVNRRELRVIIEKAEPYIDELPVRLNYDIYDEDDARLIAYELKTALMLNDWINEVKEEDIVDMYNVGSGDIYSYTQTAHWICYAAYELMKLLNKMNHAKELNKLYKRLADGVKEELLELVKIPGIGRVKARVLYNYGFTSLEKIAQAKDSEILKIPGIGPETLRSIRKFFEQKELIS